MFGPNVKSDNSGICCHHRERRFHVLLQELEETFVKKFSLDDYVLLFLTGGGTAANESVIFSFKYEFKLLFTDGEFGNRLSLISLAHGTKPNNPKMNCFAYPLYETSMSRLNRHKKRKSEFVFLDMVSAFPYYQPPKGTAIWTTVSGKQLGAYPGLGIMAIRKDLIKTNEWFRHVPKSSLSLTEYLTFRNRNETPTTPSIILFYDLLNTLKKLDSEKLTRKINERRQRIESIVDKGDVIGEGPVMTFRSKSWLMPVADKFNLYESSGGYQVFLWSGNNHEYEELYRELRRMRK